MFPWNGQRDRNMNLLRYPAGLFSSLPGLEAAEASGPAPETGKSASWGGYHAHASRSREARLWPVQPRRSGTAFMWPSLEGLPEACEMHRLRPSNHAQRGSLGFGANMARLSRAQQQPPLSTVKPYTHTYTGTHTSITACLADVPDGMDAGPAWPPAFSISPALCLRSSRKGGMAAGQTESSGARVSTLGGKRQLKGSMVLGCVQWAGSLAGTGAEARDQGNSSAASARDSEGQLAPHSRLLPSPRFVVSRPFRFAGAGSRCHAASTAHMRWQSPLTCLACSAWAVAATRFGGCFYTCSLSALVFPSSSLSCCLSIDGHHTLTRAHTPTRDLVGCDWLRQAAAPTDPAAYLTCLVILCRLTCDDPSPPGASAVPNLPGCVWIIGLHFFLFFCSHWPTRIAGRNTRPDRFRRRAPDYHIVVAQRPDTSRLPDRANTWTSAASPALSAPHATPDRPSSSRSRERSGIFAPDLSRVHTAANRQSSLAARAPYSGFSFPRLCWPETPRPQRAASTQTLIPA
ncbi:hypothetical protein MAPG_05902 [Magnaporthiopsis poae ATCC 64411]|uniref:Uncharacterized protein n=1 Tax=Magnaporthiopsis poae (strain ATCC 64411 / 73-15) TaxID=644358 RepID=A0A0C4E0M1_MAGP6|nr:hypothetical protein MAPG_05902 [Magnaporthiopsis poae ATCC 64411]